MQERLSRAVYRLYIHGSLTVATAGLVGLAIAGYYSDHVVTVSDPLGVTTVAGVTAIAVDRMIGFYWLTIDSNLGVFWPSRLHQRRLDAAIEELRVRLDRLYSWLLTEYWGSDLVEIATDDELLARSDDVDRDFDEIERSRQAIRALLVSARQQLGLLGRASDVQNTPQWALADDAVANVEAYLDIKEDNPGREIVRFVLSVLFGVLIARIFGLDLTTVVGEANSGGSATRIIATGAIIGLGSFSIHRGLEGLFGRQGKNQ